MQFTPGAPYFQRAQGKRRHRGPRATGDAERMGERQRVGRQDSARSTGRVGRRRRDTLGHRVALVTVESLSPYWRPYIPAEAQNVRRDA